MVSLDCDVSMEEITGSTARKAQMREQELSISFPRKLFPSLVGACQLEADSYAAASVFAHVVHLKVTKAFWANLASNP